MEVFNKNKEAMKTLTFGTNVFQLAPLTSLKIPKRDFAQVRKIVDKDKDLKIIDDPFKFVVANKVKKFFRLG